LSSSQTITLTDDARARYMPSAVLLIVAVGTNAWALLIDIRS
jgi:uncharacterized protein YqfB (UPF0267 family)